MHRTQIIHCADSVWEIPTQNQLHLRKDSSKTTMSSRLSPPKTSHESNLNPKSSMMTHHTPRKQKMKLSNTVPTENKHVTYTHHTTPHTNQGTDTASHKASKPSCRILVKTTFLNFVICISFMFIIGKSRDVMLWTEVTPLRLALKE